MEKMIRKFEVGKQYYESGVAYEIIKRTPKTIRYKALQHAGRYNERVIKEATVSIKIWPNREVFFCGERTIEA